MTCKKTVTIITLFFTLILCRQLTATVLVTHGLGTSGIKFYQDSDYMKILATSALQIGHTTKGIAWLSEKDPNKDYAGLLPQERIAGAVIIAKAIIDEQVKKQTIVLVGHSFGGQVMQCASRLLNPANKEITDTFVYELVCTIKNILDNEKTRQAVPSCTSPETKSITPKMLINGIAAGWHISKIVIAAIEKSKIINQNVIDFVKQHLSLDYIQATQSTWKKAFDEVQKYKAKHKTDHRNAIAMLYTIGTTFSISNIFLPDMDVITNHINLYSVDDNAPAMIGSPCAPTTPRTINLRVLFEPAKSYAPNHHQFCGNSIMAPWIFRLENFDNFVWGTTGTVTFFKHQSPEYQAD